MKKHYSKIIAISDQLLVSGTNFIIGIIITRFISIEAYGTFALYWMVFLFLQGLSNAYIGLPAQVLSNTQTDPNSYLEKNNQLGKFLLLLAILFLYLGFYFIDLFYNTSFGYGFWLFPCAIILFLKQEMNRKYFYAKQMTYKVFIIDMVTYGTLLVSFAYTAFFSTINLNLVILFFTVSGILGSITFSIIKSKNTLPFQLSELPIKENWIYARHLISTSIIQWFAGNLLLVTAGGIMGVSAIGVIRVLQNIMGVLHVLFLTLENVIPVKAAYLLNQHGKKFMKTYLKKVSLVTGAIYIGILLIIALFGENLLELLYGATYTQYTYLLHLFLIVYVLVFIGTIAQITIKTLQLNRSIFLAYVCSFIASALFSYPLVKGFGLSGIIIGFGLLQLITVSIYLITLKKAAL